MARMEACTFAQSNRYCPPSTHGTPLYNAKSPIRSPPKWPTLGTKARTDFQETVQITTSTPFPCTCTGQTSILTCGVPCVIRSSPLRQERQELLHWVVALASRTILGTTTATMLVVNTTHLN